MIMITVLYAGYLDYLDFVFIFYIQGAAEWTPTFQRSIKNERNKVQKKALFFRKQLTI
jgi:hypothetical protein